MKKKQYKEMLIKIIERWFRSYPDEVEDHHAIFDLKRELNCSEKFAIKIVRIVAQRNSSLIKDTGLGLHRVDTINEVKS